ncbi:SusC/RagA family TonB-linked outer membrane protein [Sphingobacterium spiritivorum]
MKINLNRLSKKDEMHPAVQRGKSDILPTSLFHQLSKMHFNKTLTTIVMKVQIIAFLMGIGLLQVYANSYGQNITLKQNNITLESTLKEFEKQSGYVFFYKKTDVNTVKNLNVHLEKAPLRQALNTILKDAGFSYEFFDKTVVLKKRPVQSPQALINERPLLTVSQQVYIKGKVVDEAGKPIAGASVRLKSDPQKAVSSQDDGTFTLPLSADHKTVVVSYLGFKSVEVKINAEHSPIVIKLYKSDQNIDEVVITGMINRKKETFTGATSTFSKEDLKSIGNTNIIQALKSLDPSFLVMENNIAGSNPNALATIELRGQTSISTEGLRDEFGEDPNQPLFILDGFPTTLRTITDLDINRISSITILKDAASTAIYGSRASNGVVVVETIRPKAGDININYTLDANVDLPDLSSYNMMNAAEKLEFERLSGRYIRHPRLDNPITQMHLDQLYSDRLKKINQGIDSYWLSDPVQTGFSQRHSLLVTGGEGSLVYTVGGDYKNASGAMKGSGRKTWGTTLNLSYRNQKLNINNNLYVNGYSSNESPYGSFKTWVNTNPYFEKIGPTERFLEVIQNPYRPQVEYISNPQYNASLGNFDRGKNFSLVNNLQARYDLNSSLKFSTSLQISKNDTKTNVFVSPLDNSFYEKPTLERGSLNSKNLNIFSYTWNIDGQFGKTFGKHLINAFLRTELYSKDATSNGFLAIGFPSASNGNPKFAYGYAPNGRPEASKSISRRHSIISSFNYSYDQRYNADFSFTYDGSTAFGNENIYSPFFSAGLSWNLHKEHFLAQRDWINLLRLRANIGLTGNQNFASYTSVSTYDYLNSFNQNGQGIIISALGNKDLKWQNTTQYSLGLDANLWNNKVTLQLNAYRKLTDPLVIGVALPPSTALSKYPLNAGSLTVNGLEIMTKYNIINRPQNRTMWTVSLTAATNKQIYNKFNNILESLNTSLRNNKSLIAYRDGGDPADIWTVPSMGIDPSTGLEIFLKKDGTYSYQYDWKDAVVVGNTRPKWQGVFNTNFAYKGFTTSVSIRYIYNQDIFNSALFNKVENITMQQLLKYNQDKRALYSRWKNPGDISEFRKIQLNDYNQAYNNLQGIDESTQMSSRFVQQENTISLESVSLGYEWRNKTWMQQARLSNLRLTGYLNDIARLSTIRRERGIDFPYARTVSFSLTANFR